jgi:hypothetical protein
MGSNFIVVEEDDGVQWKDVGMVADSQPGIDLVANSCG